MESKKYQHLTDSQVQCFMQHGYFRVPSAFSPSTAAAWTSDVWTRLGFSPTDKSTWVCERTHMPGHRVVEVREFAPAAWEAICEVAGGVDRVTEGARWWNDAFIVNLGTVEEEGRERAGKELGGWHVDGDFFVHFLDSPEQGLLVIPLYTDIVSNGGGTWVCSEGVRKVGKWLYDHPEGVSPWMVPTGILPQEQDTGLYSSIIQSCAEENFHEMTGKAGDVIILHPLTLHSASMNGRRLPRIITNPAVSLKEPFNFNRGDPSEYSLVELKTIKELGAENLRGWKIIGQRAPVVPDRVRIQEQRLKEEEARIEERRLDQTQSST